MSARMEEEGATCKEGEGARRKVLGGNYNKPLHMRMRNRIHPVWV